jgi:hypothetical protein
VPLFATFSGAQSLREPFNRYMFHVRASYLDETDTDIQATEWHGAQSDRCVYQNDGYGKGRKNRG